MSMDNAETIDQRTVTEKMIHHHHQSCAAGHIYKYNDKLIFPRKYHIVLILIIDRRDFSQLLLWTTVWSLKKLGWYECTNGKNESKFGQRVKGKVRETIKFRFHLNSCRTVSKLESFTEREYEAGCMKTRECKNYENINARKDWFKLRDGFLANFKKTDGEGFFTSL